jgi:hypothetical protein
MRRAIVVPLMALASVGALAGASIGVAESLGSGTSGVALQGTPYHGQQCSPGTQSKSPRLRGTLAVDNSNQPVSGQPAYVFSLPTDTNTSAYPLEACDLVTPLTPVGLGTSVYYGLMVYVPTGFTVANNSPYGVNIEEYHFQNVYGSPITLQLHSDHVTLALETGACTNHSSSGAGCAIRSNADHLCQSKPGYTCIAGEYAIPPGALVQGSWNEIVMQTTWETNNTGTIQTWYKTKGAVAWTQSSNVSGIPTVQYDSTVGTPPKDSVDETEAYTFALSSPLSVSLGNYVTGSSFASVANTMP